VLDHTPEAAAAIEARERIFTRRFRVDWRRDGKFDHPLSDLTRFVLPGWEREQVLSSTAPSELLLIEGHAAARLQVPLAGDYNGQSLAVQFAPYNRGSLFFAEDLDAEGAPCTFEVAVWTDAHGWEWFEQFRGLVRHVDADRGDGQVVIECLDNAERNRNPVSLPPFGLWESYLQQGHKRGGLIDSSSIIDLAARASGFTMGPRQFWAWWLGRPRTSNIGPILSVPFHGSVLPEIGLLDNAETFHRTELWETDPDPAVRDRAEAYRTGPHGYLALNAVPRGKPENYKKFWIDEWNKQAGSAGGTWVLGCWIYWTGPGVDESSVVLDVQIRTNHFQLYVRGGDGGVEARLIEPNGFVAWTNTPLRLGAPGWYYIEGNYIVENRQNYAMRVRVNDEYSAETRLSGRDARDVNDPLSGLCTVEHKYAVSDVYVVKANTLTTFSNFTYDRTPADTARISWGRNRLTYTLRTTAGEAFELAKDVAASEFGVVLFDEAGRFCFYNYDDVQARQTTSVRTVTLDDLGGLRFRSSLDSVRNVWTVTTTTGRSLRGKAYDLGDGVPNFRDSATGQYLPAEFVIPGISTREFFIYVNDRTIAVEPFRLPYLPLNAPWEEHTPINGCQSFTGTQYRELGPNTEQKLIDRNVMRLWMSNGYSETVGFVLVSADGTTAQPRFRIGGTVVAVDEPKTWTIRDETSIARHGERVIELGESTWRQDEWQTRAMLAELVARMGRPIPVADSITVPGDPRVQVLDCITARDPDGFVEQIRLQIYGLTRSEDDQGRLVDTYSVEVINPPAPGMWDSTSNGAWDSTFTWS